jgi:hypothetical protein
LIEHLTDVDDPHGKRSYLHDTNLSGRYRMSSISYTGLAGEHLITCRAPSSAFQYGLMSSPVAGFPPVTMQVLLEPFPD